MLEGILKHCGELTIDIVIYMFIYDVLNDTVSWIISCQII